MQPTTEGGLSGTITWVQMFVRKSNDQVSGVVGPVAVRPPTINTTSRRRSYVAHALYLRDGAPIVVNRVKIGSLPRLSTSHVSFNVTPLPDPSSCVPLKSTEVPSPRSATTDPQRS